MVRVTLGVAAALVLLAASPASAGVLKGTLSLGGGYYDNPIGIAGEPNAAFANQNLQLAALLGQGRDRFKLGYELSAAQFGNGTELGSIYNGLGWEWYRPARTNPGLVGAGLRFAARKYQDWYAYYDHRDLDAYATWKAYPRGNVMIRTVGTVRYRKYPDLPEESFIESRLTLEIKRFSPDRLTLGLEARLGAKRYNDSAASLVWETPNLPSTSQLATRLNISKGLGDRLGLRTWVETRFSLEGFPHYVAEDVFDSPLLDTYAHEGVDALGALKWLAPGLIWIEPGAAYGDRDYGELVFATEDGGALRRDSLWDYFLSLEKTFSAGQDRIRWRGTGGWRNQNSTLGTYTYESGFFSTSLSYLF